MKKFISAVFLVIMIAGCSFRNYPLGTSEAEFTSHDKLITELVEKSAERTVYKKINGQADGKIPICTIIL